MKAIGIIPARYASSRFPGKPLVNIHGKTMIRRVYEQAMQARELDEVIVATDDVRIENEVHTFGGKCCMTDAALPSGTDRVAAVLKQNPGYDLVINIQGDEPFINPAQINQLCRFLRENPNFEIATMATKIPNPAAIFSPDLVKVVFDKRNKALYFSRHPIPFVRGIDQADWMEKQAYYHHIGIYGFRATTLLQITKYPQSDLEKAESLEQLRWLENGHSIGISFTDEQTMGIDTPEDLESLLKTFRE